MNNSGFFFLSEANSFYLDIWVQTAISCSFFAVSNSIFETPQSKAASITFSAALRSNIKAHKDGYKYGGDINLFTISPTSIVTIHAKTFVITKDLAYFNKIKKHSKVWNHSTQLLKV